MIDKFSELKERVPILDLCKELGIELSANYMAKCPFGIHADKTASLKIYPQSNSFYCFGCGKGGDTIILEKLFYNFPTDLEAAKKISQDYNLNLFNNRLSYKEKTKIKREIFKRENIKLTIKSFKRWRNETQQWFSDLHRILFSVLKNCSPKESGEEPHKVWLLAANYIEHINYILDLFVSCSREKLFEKYKIINSWKYAIQREIGGI